MARRRRPAATKDAPLIAAVVKILATGEPTKFALEATCRHGLRSAFCLDGKAWSTADAHAATIVAEALRKLGVTRPTWAEANPDDVVAPIERTRCIWCGNPIPPGRGERTGYAALYCSYTCGSAARSQRGRSNGHIPMAEHLKVLAAKSAKTLAERAFDCAHCGKHVVTHERNRKFCSIACTAASTRQEPVERQCRHCGKAFFADHPSDPKPYCDAACWEAARRAGNQPRACDRCGTEFVRIGHPEAKFCSATCSRLRHTKVNPPKPCSVCEQPFQSWREDARFCSRNCRRRARKQSLQCEAA